MLFEAVEGKSVDNPTDEGHKSRFLDDKIVLQMRKEEKERSESLKKRRKKSFDREEVLTRLLCIAEEAHRATNAEKTDKNGNLLSEYDVKCATIELKALECAVKLAGFEGDRQEGICITLDDEAKELAL